MLILNRKAGESLQIGDDITITVVSLEGGRAKLAISAPKSIPILRQELITATTIANQDASKKNPTLWSCSLCCGLFWKASRLLINKIQKGVMSQ